MKCKCIKSRVLKKGKNKGQLKCVERSPKGCRLPKNWTDTDKSVSVKPVKKSKKVAKPAKKSCKCIKSRKTKKGEIKCVERSPKGCRLPKNWTDTDKSVVVSVKPAKKSKSKKVAKPVKKSCKCIKKHVLKKGKNKGKIKCVERSPKGCRLPNKSKSVSVSVKPPIVSPSPVMSKSYKTAKDSKTPDDLYYYDKNATNISRLRSKAKKEFNIYLAGGSFSKIYTNPNNPYWIFRKTKVDETEVADELIITEGMLNRPGERPNLTDIWVEDIKDSPTKAYIYSISRKLEGDGNIFVNDKKYIKNTKLVSKFYSGLYKEFQYLHSLGWACYDLKPGNILIDEANISETTDDWVKLTDFGADWCKNKNQLNDVIDKEYQPLFMLLLFQFNSIGFIRYPVEMETGFIKFINDNIIKTHDFDKLVKNLQQIYDFFLYLFIVPPIYIDPKFSSIQISFLWYTCQETAQNFKKYDDSTHHICETLDILLDYFKKINKNIKNKLNLHKNVVDIYKNIIRMLVTNNQLNIKNYDLLIKNFMFEIKTDLNMS